MILNPKSTWSLTKFENIGAKSGILAVMICKLLFLGGAVIPRLGATPAPSPLHITTRLTNGHMVMSTRINILCAAWLPSEHFLTYYETGRWRIIVISLQVLGAADSEPSRSI